MLAATPTRQSHGSEALTRGIRVRVHPWFLDEHSDPEQRRWVFGYRITITNTNATGSPPLQLLSRHWTIVDARGEAHEVRGEGVIGQQPILAPGDSHEYSSFCPLQTSWGTMEGSFRFRTAGDGPDGEREQFDADVARFYLVGPESDAR